MNKVILFTFLLLSSWTMYGQTGGSSSFEYINIPGNALQGGLGGINVSVPEVNMVTANPALLRPEMGKALSLTYIPYFADIKNTNFNYVHDLGKIGPASFGVQYFSSGSMTQTDEAGTVLGSFSANQYVVNAGIAHKINYYSLGATLKFAGSQIGPYTNYALLTDIGGVFQHPTKQFTVGLVVKNMGVSLKKYNPDSPTHLPFDVQLGTSYKLEHMPFRFSLTAHHLYVFDIVYLDPRKKGVLDDNGVEVKPKKSFADKVGRHFVLGGEFLIGKAVSLRFGYNYLRRKELRQETRSGTAGFSFGGSVKIKSFDLAYTHAVYETSKGLNFFTLTTTLGTLFKSKGKFEGQPSFPI